MAQQLDQVLQALSETISTRKISVLCGAGISYNSGLPVVHQIIDAISDKFELSVDERNVIFSSGQPFEAFVDLLEDESDIDDLLRIFKMGQYNTNHLLLAHLIQKGRIHNILTTNFDRHIENALTSLGLKENTNFKIYSTESSFSEIEWSDNMVKIIKIHGCVSDLSNMAINMMLVANQTFSANKTEVIRHFFNQTVNPYVLILGYSCSDVFDISPAIESIKNNFSEVVLLEHVFDNDPARSEQLQQREEKNPFKAFTAGTRLFFSADKFTELLWNKLELPDYQLIICGPTDWKGNITFWYNAAMKVSTEAFKHHICGRLFYNINKYDYSIAHYQKGLAIAYGLQDYRRVSSELGNLGVTYNTISNFPEAKKCLETSLEMCRNIGNTQGEITQSGNLANIYRNEGRYKDAELNYLTAIRLAEKQNNETSLCMSLGNLALVYNLTGQYSKTVNCARQGIEIGNRLGKKQAEASQLSSLGIAYYSLGNKTDGFKCLKKSISISKLIGDRNSESMCLANLARLYLQESDHESSLAHLSKVLIIISNLKIPQTEGLTYYLMAENYIAMSKKEDAVMFLKKALNIFQDIYPDNHPFLNSAKRKISNLAK